MKLYGSYTSPFVRKCRVAAIELGLKDAIAFEETAVKPTMPNVDYGSGVNPVRRVPALATEDAGVLADSALIVEYLDAKAGGGQLIPATGADRFRALNRAAIASGATDALVLAMYEGALRPQTYQWTEWRVDQMDKAHAAIVWFEVEMDPVEGAFDVGAIALGCFLGYADFRFGNIDWLAAAPRLKAWWTETQKRPSFEQTAPPQ
ncbi:MAG: glutathione S-transferase family protein [Pseudomonadota bacterium]